MFSFRQCRPLVVVCLVLLLGFPAASRPRKMQRVQVGSWGGQSIRINIGQSSAVVDYACANGTINGPLTVDSGGRFTWRGIHNPERGGPIRIDAKPNGQAVIYSGWIKGDTMTLTVKLAKSDTVLDTFTLQRGSTGRIRKCK